MKRFFLCIITIIFVFPLFAKVNIKFNPISQVPLYREPVADPYAFNTHLNVVFATDMEKRPNKIYSIITQKVGCSQQ